VELSGLKSISQSHFGLTAATDVDNKLWAWSQDIGFGQELGLAENPRLVKPLRNRFVDRVFVGRNTLFALGEDMVTGNRKIKLKDKENNQPREK
jgi:hypothetical protein